MSWFSIFMMGFAVSFDSIAAGIAYGFKDIRISASSITVIGLVTSLCSAIAMILAYSAGAFISSGLAIALGALLLMLLGVLNILQNLVSAKLPLYNTNNQPANLSNQANILDIIIQPENADIDHSKSIAGMEAACLGVALGIDNAIAVFGACLLGDLPIYTPLIMGCIQMLFIETGFLLSSRFTSSKLKQKISYVSGIILILLGLSRLL